MQNNFENHQPEQGPVDRSEAAFVLGLIGLVAWILPIAGLPIQIIALVFAVKSMKYRKWQATTGLVLAIIGLVLTTINAGIGAYMGATGHGPFAK